MSGNPFKYIHVITKADVGKSHHRIAGRTWPVSGWIGSVLPGDVGKRVYLSDDVLQVENDEQRDERVRSLDAWEAKARGGAS